MPKGTDGNGEVQRQQDAYVREAEVLLGRRVRDQAAVDRAIAADARRLDRSLLSGSPEWRRKVAARSGR